MGHRSALSAPGGLALGSRDDGPQRMAGNRYTIKMLRGTERVQESEDRVSEAANQQDTVIGGGKQRGK